VIGESSKPREAPINLVDLCKEIDRWVRQMRQELPLVDVICNVAERMYQAKGEERRILAGELETFLLLDGDYDNALQVLDMMIEDYPDDVGLLSRKASLYFYHLEDPEEALKWIDLTLERAERTGFFRRQTLGVKARILLELGRGDQLSDVLEEIMSLRIVKGIPDIGRERDFADRAPPGLIREDVLARYNEFRPRRAGDTAANEPPRFEFPDDAVWTH
jgi:tetratricopeptide (TPR) repeat protein